MLRVGPLWTPPSQLIVPKNFAEYAPCHFVYISDTKYKHDNVGNICDNTLPNGPTVWRSRLVRFESEALWNAFVAKHYGLHVWTGLTNPTHAYCSGQGCEQGY